MKASSTLAAVLADVSMKIRPCSRAKASPSSLLTSLLASKSLKPTPHDDSDKDKASNASPLVADEHDDHVAVAVLSGVLQPGGQVVEGVSPGDVVHKERSCGPPVVGAGDGSERLLSSLD